MGQLSVTAIDILVVVVILVSAGYAGFRGLVHETFAIIEWVVAGYIALRFTPLFQPLLRDYISPPWLEWIAVFVATFLIVFIPLSIMSHRLSEQVKKSEIGPIDRTLGAVFGLARGLVIVGFASRSSRHVNQSAAVSAYSQHERRAAFVNAARSQCLERRRCSCQCQAPGARIDAGEDLWRR